MYMVKFNWHPYTENQPQKLKDALHWCEHKLCANTCRGRFLNAGEMGQNPDGFEASIYVIIFNNEEDLVEFKLSCL